MRALPPTRIHGHDGVIGFEPDLLPKIGDVEERVDAAIDPERDAGARALIVERSLELDAGAPLAAP